MTNEEIIQKFAFEEYPENISYSTVIEKMVDYNWRYRNDFIKGAEKIAEWKDKQFAEEKQQWIEKTIGWIDDNNRNGGCWFDGWEEDFKKAMEE